MPSRQVGGARGGALRRGAHAREPSLEERLRAAVSGAPLPPPRAPYSTGRLASMAGGFRLAPGGAAAVARRPGAPAPGLRPARAARFPAVRHEAGAAPAECAICLRAFEAGEALTKLPCNEAHRFHSACLRPWLERHGSCPMCRAHL